MSKPMTGNGSRYHFEMIGGLVTVLRQAAREQGSVDGDTPVPTGREAAHLIGEAYSPLNGRQPIFALLGHDDLQTLEGRLLTLADASFSDAQQRKAFKDMLRREIWFNWVKYLDTDEPSGGMPDRG